MKQLFVVIIALALIGGIIWFLIPQTSAQIISECVANNGRWLSDYQECDFGGDAKPELTAWCSARGGAYESCASPCRHEGSAAACIAVCANVCTF